MTSFYFSSGQLNERLLRGTAKRQGVILTGILQLSDVCLEAKGVRAGVPRRTTSRAGKPMETVHIDLCGPNEASMGPSVSLTMLVDIASRLMWACGMKSKSEAPRSR